VLDKSAKLSILVFLSHYLPAYKAGGQLRTIVNMVEHLSDEFEFWIITSDRDLGDVAAFPTIKTDSWQLVGKAHVYYASPVQRTPGKFARLIAATPHHVLYLNSFFSFDFSIKPLLAVKFYSATQQPVILAPRGEFSVGALGLKQRKKRVYIQVSQMIGLYHGVLFQASSAHEVSDIIAALKIAKEQIRIAMDLPAVVGSEPKKQQDGQDKRSDGLRIIFLSRLSPMKNLLYALKVLQSVSRNVQFDIYGPQEDSSYWAQCKKLINELPAHVKARYCGSLKPADVQITFSQYDLFLFPTLGENYGHVIAESLQAGTPVLISDQTPWKNLAVDGLGWDIPLSSLHGFIERVEQFEPMDRAVIQGKTLKRLYDPEVFQSNRNLFYSVL